LVESCPVEIEPGLKLPVVERTAREILLKTIARLKVAPPFSKFSFFCKKYALFFEKHLKK